MSSRRSNYIYHNATVPPQWRRGQKFTYAFWACLSYWFIGIIFFSLGGTNLLTYSGFSLIHTGSKLYLDRHSPKSLIIVETEGSQMFFNLTRPRHLNFRWSRSTAEKKKMFDGTFWIDRSGTTTASLKTVTNCKELKSQCLCPPWSPFHISTDWKKHSEVCAGKQMQFSDYIQIYHTISQHCGLLT